MKISPIRPAISKKQQVMQNIKRGFWFAGMLVTEFGLAVKDSFTREKPYYVEINGKMVDERDLPSAVSRHDEWTNAKWGETIFYPEDIEKMKNMTVQERIKYKGKLMDEKRCTTVWHDPLKEA